MRDKFHHVYKQSQLYVVFKSFKSGRGEGETGESEMVELEKVGKEKTSNQQTKRRIKKHQSNKTLKVSFSTFHSFYWNESFRDIFQIYDNIIEFSIIRKKREKL